MRKKFDILALFDDLRPSYYQEIYDEMFKSFVDKQITLLELGVFKGESLQRWRDYFQKGIIVGLDRDPVNLDDPTGRIHIYQGNQDDTNLLDHIAKSVAPEGFDLIIDDCSHVGELTRVSFWHLFEYHLKPGGLYAIEDFGTGYIHRHCDGKRFKLTADSTFSKLRSVIISPVRSILDKTFIRQSSNYSRFKKLYLYRKRIPSHIYGMVGFVKEIVDACTMNESKHMWGGGPSRFSKVHKVHISRNLVIVEKAPSQKNNK